MLTHRGADPDSPRVLTMIRDYYDRFDMARDERRLFGEAETYVRRGLEALTCGKDD